jgi:hypothetical protein
LMCLLQSSKINIKNEKKCKQLKEYSKYLANIYIGRCINIAIFSYHGHA